MDVIQAAKQRRSIRRFTAQPIPRVALMAMTESARLAPTGMNNQPLQFVVVSKRALCEAIFPHTAWAKRIPNGSAGPDESTQPAAYILILVDKTLATQSDTDCGAAAMSILLAAEAMGIASCWLGSIDRADILSLCEIDASRFALHTIVALGYPAMRSRAVSAKDGDVAYFLESPDVLCVPKRLAGDVVHWLE